MAYTLNWANPNLAPIIIQPGTVDNSTSLTLTGKGYLNYGQEQQTDLILLLANFASPTAPPNQVQGQLWYDTTNLTMMVWNGAVWATCGTGSAEVTASITAGTTTRTTAQFTANATNGIPPYTYTWSFGSDANVSLNSTTAENVILTLTGNSSDSGTLQCVIADSNSSSATVTIPYAFTLVNLNVNIVNPGPTSSSSEVFTSTVSGGTAPYTYAWSLTGSSNPSNNGSVTLSSLTNSSTTATCTGTPPVNYGVSLTITDSIGNTGSNSATSTFNVNSTSVTLTSANTSWTDPAGVTTLATVAGYGATGTAIEGVVGHEPSYYTITGGGGTLGTSFTSTVTVASITGSNIESDPSASVTMLPLYHYSGLSLGSKTGTIPNGTYSVSGTNPAQGDLVAPTGSVTFSGNAVTSASLTGVGLTENASQNDSFFVIIEAGVNYAVFSSTASVPTGTYAASLAVSGGTFSSGAAITVNTSGGGQTGQSTSVTPTLTQGAPIYGTTGYTPGANATAFGFTFPGSANTSAPATTTENNVSVVPGTVYPISIPTGGQIVITYT